MIDLMNLQPNKVSISLVQYPIILLSEKTGVGKTTIMRDYLKKADPKGREPLFIELEDRYQHISGIMAIRVHNIAEIEQIKNQLKLPQMKEKFSCVVIDTLDALDTIVETAVSKTNNVEIVGDIGFGKGNKKVKSKEYFVDELREAGWQVFACCQSQKCTDIITNAVSYEPKVNKETWKKFSEPAYAIGMISCDSKGERSISFTPSAMYPDLKNSLGIKSGKIKAKDLFAEIEKSVKDMAGDDYTEEVTVAKEYKKELTFDELVTKGNDLGSKLFEANKVSDAMAILGTTLGYKDDDNKQPKNFTDMVEAQYEVVELAVVKLQELVTRLGL